MNLAFLTDVVRVKVEARIVEFPRRMSGTEIFGIPSKTNECTPSPVLRHGAEHRTLPRKKNRGLRGIWGPYRTGPPGIRCAAAEMSRTIRATSAQSRHSFEPFIAPGLPAMLGVPVICVLDEYRQK
jgi:hypothetical protein